MRYAATICLTLVVTVSSLIGPASVVARGSAGGGPGGPMAWIDAGMQLSSFLPVRGILNLLGQNPSLPTGNDGRFTVLLLGSDTRSGGFARTDSIMVASIPGGGGAASFASIPRDSAHIPVPSDYTTCNGDSGAHFSARVNAILKYFRRSMSASAALDKFTCVIENLLRIEIDRYALISFVGFNSLVDNVDDAPAYGIPVFNPIAIRDTVFWDDPNYKSGVYFPYGTNYLHAVQPGKGNGLCDGRWRDQSYPPPSAYWCRRALPFVRSRKGASNSDFVRERRQQYFVQGATKQVRSRSGSQLVDLISLSLNQMKNGNVYTNLINSTNAYSVADDLYHLLQNATFSSSNMVVFEPTYYATHISGTTAYQLNLTHVREWSYDHLGGKGP